MDIDTITEFRPAPGIACQPGDATGVGITALPMSPGPRLPGPASGLIPTH